MRRSSIDFLGYKRYMFAFSTILLVIAIGSLLLRGLTFGIEFQGGTTMTFEAGEDVTTEQIRSALDDAGLAEATIQPVEGEGFLVRTSESDVGAAQDSFHAVVDSLSLEDQTPTVTTIGPNWGANITNRALLALAQVG